MNTSSNSSDEASSLEAKIAELEKQLAVERKQRLAEKKRADAAEKRAAHFEALAHTDKLTGLPNRLDFDKRIQAALDLVLREKGEVAVMIVDIDHFKAFNDTHGHKAGDAVLVNFAKIIDHRHRPSDTLARMVNKNRRRKPSISNTSARWGGEEFALILPFCTAENALKIGEELRLEVASTVMDLSGVSSQNRSTSVNITASFGVAMIETSDNAATIIKRADSALYYAKKNGRNQVCLKPVNDAFQLVPRSPPKANSAPTAIKPRRRTP